MDLRPGECFYFVQEKVIFEIQHLTLAVWRCRQVSNYIFSVEKVKQIIRRQVHFTCWLKLLDSFILFLKFSLTLGSSNARFCYFDDLQNTNEKNLAWQVVLCFCLLSQVSHLFIASLCLHVLTTFFEVFTLWNDACSFGEISCQN